MVGKPCDGNKTGAVTFKVRKNEDVKNFDKKNEEIKENLKDLGLEVKSNVRNTMKPK